MYTCVKEDDVCLQALLTHKANMEVKCDNGVTSLMIASTSGHLGVVEVSYSF